MKKQIVLWEDVSLGISEELGVGSWENGENSIVATVTPCHDTGLPVRKQNKIAEQTFYESQQSIRLYLIK